MSSSSSSSSSSSRGPAPLASAISHHEAVQNTVQNAVFSQKNEYMYRGSYSGQVVLKYYYTVQYTTTCTCTGTVQP